MQSKHNRNISEQNAPILYRDTQLSENHQRKAFSNPWKLFNLKVFKGKHKSNHILPVSMSAVVQINNNTTKSFN